MGLNPLTTGIGGALSLAGSIYAAVKGGKANRENEAIVKEQQEELEAWKNNNSNYLDTVEGKSMVEQAREAYDSRSKQDASTAVITGATPEAELAAKEASNKGFNDLYRNIASQGSQYARQNEGIYRQSLSNIYAQRMNINSQKAQNAANLGNNAGNMFGTAAYAGLFDKK